MTAANSGLGSARVSRAGERRDRELFFGLDYVN
jgi:hypothetical protein